MTLELILPVATASVERVFFSAMNILKSDFRNQMRDIWMNDSMILYIEKNIFNNTDNGVIMRSFQNSDSKNRRGQL